MSTAGVTGAAQLLLYGHTAGLANGADAGEDDGDDGEDGEDGEEGEEEGDCSDGEDGDLSGRLAADEYDDDDDDEGEAEEEAYRNGERGYKLDLDGRGGAGEGAPKGKGRGKSQGGKPPGAKAKTTGAFDPANKDKMICYAWSEGRACNQTPCHFEHVCWFCEDPGHQGKDCPNR